MWVGWEAALSTCAEQVIEETAFLRAHRIFPLLVPGWDPGSPLQLQSVTGKDLVLETN